MKKLFIITVLISIMFTYNCSYAAMTEEQYFSQIFKYMEQFVNSHKPQHVSYEYFPEFMDDSLNIYSVVYKNSKTSLIRNFYDNNFRENGAWPYFRTTDSAYSIGGIKVGSSVKPLSKSSIFYKNKGNKYSMDYEGSLMNFYYNKKGIITCIELIYYDEPFTSAAMDFINGKVKANVK